MVRPVIHSTKHYVQFSIATVTGGANLTLGFVKAVAVAGKNSVEEVEEGAIVKAIYVEVWVRAGSATASSGQAVIYKLVAESAAPSTTDMAALGLWDNKKNIFYTTMGLFNDQDANAIVIYKGWLKIPKGKQRMGLNDRINLTIFANTVDLHVCGFCTYKEYT